VARLHQDTLSKIRSEFDGDIKVTYHLAAPIISKLGSDGKPKKKEYGRLMDNVFFVLKNMKVLRGTVLDPFGYSSERKMERSFIMQFEADMNLLLSSKIINRDAAIALAEIPLQVKGFGYIKEKNYKSAMIRRDELILALRHEVFSKEAAE
jgi:indolepyruvate ferredoxin oxidoreductase